MQNRDLYKRFITSNHEPDIYSTNFKSAHLRSNSKGRPHQLQINPSKIALISKELNDAGSDTNATICTHKSWNSLAMNQLRTNSKQNKYSNRIELTLNHRSVSRGDLMLSKTNLLNISADSLEKEDSAQTGVINKWLNRNQIANRDIIKHNKLGNMQRTFFELNINKEYEYLSRKKVIESLNAKSKGVVENPIFNRETRVEKSFFKYKNAFEMKRSIQLAETLNKIETTTDTNSTIFNNFTLNFTSIAKNLRLNYLKTNPRPTKFGNSFKHNLKFEHFLYFFYVFF